MCKYRIEVWNYCGFAPPPKTSVLFCVHIRGFPRMKASGFPLIQMFIDFHDRIYFSGVPLQYLLDRIPMFIDFHDRIFVYCKCSGSSTVER